MARSDGLPEAARAKEARWFSGSDALVVVIGALAMVGTLPGRTHGLGLFTKSILNDFQLTAERFGTINLWATLLGAAFCLAIGRIIDRFGAGRVLTGAALALGATVLLISRIEGVPALFGAILLTRGLGQSALSVVSLAIVGKWFSRRVGSAMGIYSFLVGLGFIGAFACLREVLPRVEWRTAWSGIGWVLILGLAPLGLLLRRRPKERTTPGDDGSLAGDTEQTGFTLGQALLTPTFWVFGISSAMYLLISSGVSLFNELILNDLGFASRTYHTALLFSTATALASNFLGGWLAARWSMGRVMGIGLALLTCALLAFPNLKTDPHVFLQASILGTAGGIVTVVFFAIWGQAFGRAHLGKIQGVAQMLTVLASAVGPLLFAECKRLTGAYNLMFYTLAPLVAVLGAWVWFGRIPNPAETTTSPAISNSTNSIKGELAHAGNVN
jgi:MFS family permease